MVIVIAVGHTSAVSAVDTSTVSAVREGDTTGWRAGRATWGWSSEDGYRSQGGDEEGGEEG